MIRKNTLQRSMTEQPAAMTRNRISRSIADISPFFAVYIMTYLRLRCNSISAPFFAECNNFSAFYDLYLSPFNIFIHSRHVYRA